MENKQGKPQPTSLNQLGDDAVSVIISKTAA